MPDAHICGLLRDRRYEDAREYWLRRLGGRPLSLEAFPHLLDGHIGVQEWVSFISSAEELNEDLYLSQIGMEQRAGIVRGAAVA
jgi:hypothetical protein